MKIKRLFFAAAISLMATSAASHAATIRFSGYDWTVRGAGVGGPGPNNWTPNNVWVDANGELHLKLTQVGGTWYCSEVYTTNRLGFGRYQFQLKSRVDILDPYVVFGLFNYPTPDVGPDATHEIDIEFAKWGNPSALIGNYTVWPTRANLSPATKHFAMSLVGGDWSTHRFTWNSTSVFFQSMYGHYDDNSNQFASWLYSPTSPSRRISQKAMPVHINLWLFTGHAPTNGQEVEVVVSSFKFIP
jgi:hypothetical protein